MSNDASGDDKVVGMDGNPYAAPASGGDGALVELNETPEKIAREMMSPEGWRGPNPSNRYKLEYAAHDADSRPRPAVVEMIDFVHNKLPEGKKEDFFNICGAFAGAQPPRLLKALADIGRNFGTDATFRMKCSEDAITLEVDAQTYEAHIKPQARPDIVVESAAAAVVSIGPAASTGANATALMADNFVFSAQSPKALLFSRPWVKNEGDRVLRISRQQEDEVVQYIQKNSDLLSGGVYHDTKTLLDGLKDAPQTLRGILQELQPLAVAVNIATRTTDFDGAVIEIAVNGARYQTNIAPAIAQYQAEQKGREV